MSLLFAVCFLGALGLAVPAGLLPLAVPVVYVALSALLFVIYAIDKSAARQRRRRTRERTLHLLALAGGWPGALAAQSVVRHKSAKLSFLLLFWLTVALNMVALVAGWLWAEGRWSPLAG